MSRLKKIFLNIPEYRFFVLLFLFSITIYVTGLLRVKSIIWGDSLYYYAYTRSIIVDGDIDFSNEAYRPLVGFPNPPEISEVTNKVTNKFSPGTAVAWAPGFVVGQSISTLIASFFDLGVNFTDGYGVITQYFVAVSTILFSVTGLWFVYQTLKDIFNKRVSVLASLLLFFTTPLFYYTAVDPVNSHSISFLLSSVLLFQLVKLIPVKTTWQKVIPMGIVAGLLVLVRNQDVVVVLPTFLYLVFFKKDSWLNRLNWATLFAGFAFVVFGIQLFVVESLFGVLGSPYLIRGETFSWLNPDFLRVLFSFENGLFFFSPILFGAFGALLVGLLNKGTSLTRTNLLPIIKISMFAFVLQLYVIASWAPEIIGGPYGSRMFISVLPHLSIGLGLLILMAKNSFSKKVFSIGYSLILFLLSGNMVLQTAIMLYRF